MKKTLSLLIAAVFFMQNLPVLYAVENAIVESVRVSSENVYITTDKPVQYKAFTIGQPPKLVLELRDTRLKTLEDIPVNGSLLKRVRTGQFQTVPVSISRVVLELSQKAAYEITRKGAELAVMLGDKPALARLAVKDTPAGVRLRRTSLPAEAVMAGTVPAGAKVIAPSGSAVPDKVIEVKMEPAPMGPKDLSKESVPVIMPKKTQSARSSSRNIMENLSREPVSFDYNEASIREVIGMMAAKAGVNIIYSDDVSGSITINLNKVPFEEAFKTILDIKGFSARQVGDNILRVASPQTFIAEQKKAMLQTRVFFLNYSKASEVKTQVDAVITAENRKANCVVDDANNALIVTDTPMGLGETARLLKNLDRVPKQVLIEAKLVEVSLDSEFDMGINWGYSFLDSKNRYIGMGNANNTFSLRGTDVTLPLTAKGGTGVDLAAKNIYGGLRLGRIGSNYVLDLAITAAAKKGKAKVLSNPKVATLNNKEANINITNQTPYTTTEITTGSGGSVATTQVTYITTGIILKVLPTINSDGRITMKVSPSVSQPSQAVLFTAPSVDTRSADTNVIVRDGETIVIGGLIHDSQSDVVYKVPVLGDIPLLGSLFRKKSVSRVRMELLIFVTPKIIED